MAVNGLSSAMSKFRVSGLATGMDTDSMVKQLMSIEKLPLDKLTQKKQLAEWKRDDYRSTTNLLRGFKDDFFDVLKPSSNMRSQSVYQKYTSTSSDKDVVTATASSGVMGTSHTIYVEQTASSSNATSTGTVTKPMIGEIVANVNINSYNNSFILTFNGTRKTITLKNDTYADAAAIVNGTGVNDGLKHKVQEAFGGAITVDAVGGKIQFTSANTTDVISTTSNLVADNFTSVLKVNSSGQGQAINFPLNIEKGRKFTISIVDAGVTKTKEIEWGSTTNYNDSVALATDIQNMVNNPAVFGAGKITVDGTGGKLTFTKDASVTSMTISDSNNNNMILQNIGFKSGASGRLSLSDTVRTVSEKLGAGAFTIAGGKVTVRINDTNITVNADDTLSTFLSAVNSSSAGVTLSYSSYSDKFTMTSKTAGASSIDISEDTSNFFTKINILQGNINAGTDAKFKLDGLDATRATNTFTVDGVTYNLLKADKGTTPEEIAAKTKTITLSQDADGIYNNIKSFVDKYNEVLDTLNKKLSEEYNRDYQPLTDDQRSAMNEDDIKKWEDKAKTGLLRNDSILSKIVSDMRKAVYDTVDGISGNLQSIGITTGTYEQRGKLIIDETKLKDAIKNSPDKVMNLFSKESTTTYSPDSSSTLRNKRYSENGVVNRLYDILEDNIRTSRGKGTLLEKAGMVGDSSEIKNMLFEEIYGYEVKMSSISNQLVDKENRYYAKFAAMESAISKMNSQSSWLSSQLGGK